VTITEDKIGQKATANNDGDGTTSGYGFSDGYDACSYRNKRCTTRTNKNTVDGQSERTSEGYAATATDAAGSNFDARNGCDARTWIVENYGWLMTTAKAITPHYADDAAQHACYHLLKCNVESQMRKTAATNAMRTYATKHGHSRWNVRLQRVRFSVEVKALAYSSIPESPSMIFWDSLPLTKSEKIMVRRVIEDDATMKAARKTAKLNKGSVAEQQRHWRRAMTKLKVMRCHSPNPRTQ
jgi:hypothetical protein